jgi:hypothetical protein
MVLLFAAAVIADFRFPIADFGLRALVFVTVATNPPFPNPKTKAKDPKRKSAIGNRRSAIIFRG